MERTRRLAQFWNWLPSFRAVGEAEHLPSAAEALGISAPGLSRTIKQLEESLGRPLFLRHKQGIALSEDGRTFLEAVRRAMRLIDNARMVFQRTEHEGAIRIAASQSMMFSLVMPAVLRVTSEYPELRPELLHLNPDEAGTQLRNGVLDIALFESTKTPEALHAVRLCELSYGVYAGKNNPWAGQSMSLEELQVAPFVGPIRTLSDGWPPEITRNLKLRVQHLGLGISACESGKYLGHFPTSVADRLDTLVRIPVPIKNTQFPVFAVHRPPLESGPTRVDLVVEALKAVAAELRNPVDEAFAPHHE